MSWYSCCLSSQEASLVGEWKTTSFSQRSLAMSSEVRAVGSETAMPIAYQTPRQHADLPPLIMNTFHACTQESVHDHGRTA